MEQVRKPFQGVLNIIRFNWHFYLIPVILMVLLYTFNHFLINSIIWIDVVCLLMMITALLSLLVSWYVYDLSGLYALNWLNGSVAGNGTIINIHAGFDETSMLLNKKYVPKEFIVLDFYNPLLHTEVSIKRARKAYAPFPGTRKINTSDIPFPANYADKIFVIFSAHEIRNEKERISFLNELVRILKPTGNMVITEHMRDIPNFFAYNIGFFHFFSKSSWLKVFRAAQLNILNEIKITPFVTTFILEKNGVAS